MKKLIYASLIFLLYGCTFVDNWLLPDRHNEDHVDTRIIINNNSNKSVYFYINYGKLDSLPLMPDLRSLDYLEVYEKSHFVHINRGMTFPEDDTTQATLFFITRDMLRNNTLEELYRKQLYAKKVTVTATQLKESNNIYNYTP